jgi:hypothetical protein
MALAFAVFTHLPLSVLQSALPKARSRFPRLQKLLFTVFLAPDPLAAQSPLRQPDGVVTHPDRAPYHHLPSDVLGAAERAGFTAALSDPYLPRGQILCTAIPS